MMAPQTGPKKSSQNVGRQRDIDSASVCQFLTSLRWQDRSNTATPQFGQEPWLRGCGTIPKLPQESEYALVSNWAKPLVSGTGHGATSALGNQTRLQSGRANWKIRQELSQASKAQLSAPSGCGTCCRKWQWTTYSLKFTTTVDLSHLVCNDVFLKILSPSPSIERWNCLHASDWIW